LAHLITDLDSGAALVTNGWHDLFDVFPEGTPARTIFEQGYRRKDGQPGVIRFTEAPVTCEHNGLVLESKDHKCIVREDTKHIVSTVTSGFKIVQPEDMYDLALGAATQGQLVIDTAFTMQGGARCVICCRGQEFSIGGSHDRTVPYVCFANGNDGSLAFHAIPTSTRVVCNNTLRMALSGRSAYTFKHTGDVTLKLKDITAALAQFDRSQMDFKQKAEALAARVWSREDRQSFFLSMYEKHFEPIPENPTTEADTKKVEKSQEILADWIKRFDFESSLPNVSRGSAYLAANAVTHWLDHKRNHRVAADRKDEARLNYNLLGNGADTKVAIFNDALALI